MSCAALVLESSLIRAPFCFLTKHTTGLCGGRPCLPVIFPHGYCRVATSLQGCGGPGPPPYRFVCATKETTSLPKELSNTFAELDSLRKLELPESISAFGWEAGTALSVSLMDNIVNEPEKQPVFAVFFPPCCVLLLAGREPACVVGLARRKKSSQIHGCFSSSLTIKPWF